MRHVALMIPSLDRLGGAERQVMFLAKGLRARAWRVTVIALAGTGGESRAELEAGGAGFVSLAMRKGLVDLRGWMRLIRWLGREQPEIVHAHMPHAAWMARWARLVAPVRVVVDTVHTSAAGTAGRRWGYRLSRRLPEWTTAVSKAALDAYVDTGMVAAGRASVIANGIDTELWRPDATMREAMRRERNWDGEFVWLAAGRLEPVKDYPAALRAFAQAPVESRLVIAGSGTEEQAFRRLAGELGIAERAHFLGFVPDVRRWMQAVDGFVLSSRWEGLPMGLIEAAACGLPVVATDVPGSREAIVDGETGWLAAAGSSADLAEKMRLLMSAGSGQRAAMGERARQRAIERYSLDRVIGRWEELFHGLLDRSPGMRCGAHGK